jgi:hypothetical protein
MPQFGATRKFLRGLQSHHRWPPSGPDPASENQGFIREGDSLLKIAQQFSMRLAICFVTAFAVAACIASAHQTAALHQEFQSNGYAQTQSSKDDTASATNGKNKTITFSPNSFEDGFDLYDGAFLAWRAYTASNSEIVGITSRTFDSVDSLDAYVKWQLRKGAKIKARKPRLNAAGDKIGERILMVRRVTGPDNIDRTFTILAWTDGTTYHEISGASASVKTILSMEKWIGVK